LVLSVRHAYEGFLAQANAQGAQVPLRVYVRLGASMVNHRPPIEKIKKIKNSD
jgi:hypothetical protein